MKVNIIKEHESYPLGIADVSEGRGNYLIRVGVAKCLSEGIAGEVGPELINLPPNTELVTVFTLPDEPDEISEVLKEKPELKGLVKEKVEVKKVTGKVKRK